MADNKRESIGGSIRSCDESKSKAWNPFEYSGGDNEARIAEGDSKPSDISIRITADVGEALTGFKALQRELRETTKAARELEQAYKDAETAVNSDKIASINSLRDIQGQPGNWDDSEYMRGLYNGLELASATLEGRDPEYKTDTFEDLKEFLSECDDEIE